MAYISGQLLARKALSSKEGLQAPNLVQLNRFLHPKQADELLRRHNCSKSAFRYHDNILHPQKAIGRCFDSACMTLEAPLGLSKALHAGW